MRFSEFEGLAKFFEAEAFQCYLIELGWSDHWGDAWVTLTDGDCFDSSFKLLEV